MLDFLRWWCYGRWNIYCPKGDYSWVHDSVADRIDLFAHGLFDYDEVFVSPCTFNEINCGGPRLIWTGTEFGGTKWTPKVAFMPGMIDRENDKDYDEDQ